jgi:hypothetical protein
VSTIYTGNHLASRSGRLNCPCGEFHPVSVTVVYLLDGTSEPREERFLAEPGESIDSLADRAGEVVWNRMAEVIDIRDMQGHSLWSGSRFGDLS